MYFQKLQTSPAINQEKKWVNKGIDRYNKSIKSCLQTNKEEMYSIETKNNLLFLKNLLDYFYY